jgi:butyryl-CoA dehydrogenase
MIRLDRQDLEFQLFNVLDLQGLCRDRYGDYDRDIAVSILDTAEALARDEFLPHAAKADAQEPRFEDGRALLIPEIANALEKYRDSGFFGAGFDAGIGGMQMPETLRSAVTFLFYMANIGTSGYILLTNGAANVLAAFGSPEQKTRFLEPMVAGRFFGTMCLSEPHAGSSLADITTQALPQGDGVYHLQGRKMWISGGEQEISENIVHLVLAKVPGSAPGVKGISLFIVPKYRVAADGSLGARNGVSLAGLNHKMGYRGTTNTALNFGEDGPCEGYLVGEEGRGLGYMFHMMNEARVAVGLGATGLGAAGYQVSLAYARERTQGRRPDAKDPTLPAVPIIQHADVRRLLLAQKAAVEGSLALLLYTASLIDRARLETDATRREDLHLLLGFLTPIAKSWPSEFCLEANKHAIQVLGGAGYTRDYPVERLYRDNRLNPIHEGTHGIHGIDLLGRKLGEKQGRAFALWQTEMRSDIERAKTLDSLTEFADTLDAELSAFVEMSDAVLKHLAEDPAAGLANATLYLDLAGHLSIGWMWLRQARVALEQQAAGEGNADHQQGKLGTCQYFFRYVLTQAGGLRELLARCDRTTLDFPEAGF